MTVGDPRDLGEVSAKSGQPAVGMLCSELVLWHIIIIIWGRGRENRREAEGEDVFRGQMARYGGRCREEDRREGTEDMTGCGRGAEGRGHE